MSELTPEARAIHEKALEVLAENPFSVDERKRRAAFFRGVCALADKLTGVTWQEYDDIVAKERSEEK